MSTYISFEYEYFPDGQLYNAEYNAAARQIVGELDEKHKACAAYALAMQSEFPPSQELVQKGHFIKIRKLLSDEFTYSEDIVGFTYRDGHSYIKLNWSFSEEITEELSGELAEEVAKFCIAYGGNIVEVMYKYVNHELAFSVYSTYMQIVEKRYKF